MASNNTLPPIPFKADVIDSNGKMSAPWNQFMTELLKRVGGPYSTPVNYAEVYSSYTEDQIASGTPNKNELESVEKLFLSDSSNLLIKNKIEDVQRLLISGSIKSQNVTFSNWTPTYTGLTVVGAVTNTGKFTRIKNLLFFEAVITPVGAGTSASTLGTTFINNLPYKCGHTGIFQVVRVTTRASIGSGVVDLGTKNCYTPTWAATNNTITMNGIIRITEG